MSRGGLKGGRMRGSGMNREETYLGGISRDGMGGGMISMVGMWTWEVGE